MQFIGGILLLLALLGAIAVLLGVVFEDDEDEE